MLNACMQYVHDNDSNQNSQIFDSERTNDEPERRVVDSGTDALYFRPYFELLVFSDGHEHRASWLSFFSHSHYFLIFSCQSKRNV